MADREAFRGTSRLLPRAVGVLLRGPVTTIEVYPTAGSGLGAGVADELADGLVIDQRLSCPIDADWTEETMLDRIPLGGSGRIMGDCDAQASRVRHTLQSALPSVHPRPIGAAGVGQDEELAGTGMSRASGAPPPLVDGVGREGWRVVRRTDDDEPVGAGHVVDPVGDGHALGVAAEVIHADVHRRPAPRPARVLEQADQLALLGINADDRLASPHKRLLQAVDFVKLALAVLRGSSRQALAVVAKTVFVSAEQSPRLGVTDSQRTRHHTSRLAGPFHAGRWIPGGRLVHHLVQPLGQVWPFFRAPDGRHQLGECGRPGPGPCPPTLVARARW